MAHLKKKIIYVVALGVLLINACGIIDGPSDSDLKNGAKKSLSKQFDSTRMDDNAKKELEANLEALTATKKGICNVQKEVYNCAAEVTFKAPGTTAAETKTVVISMKKVNNNWELIE